MATVLLGVAKLDASLDLDAEPEPPAPEAIQPPPVLYGAPSQEARIRGRGKNSGRATSKACLAQFLCSTKAFLRPDLEFAEAPRWPSWLGGHKRERLQATP